MPRRKRGSGFVRPKSHTTQNTQNTVESQQNTLEPHTDHQDGNTTSDTSQHDMPLTSTTHISQTPHTQDRELVASDAETSNTDIISPTQHTSTHTHSKIPSSAKGGSMDRLASPRRKEKVNLLLLVIAFLLIIKKIRQNYNRRAE